MPEWVIKYWAEWAFGTILAILAALFKHLSNKFKREREERIEKEKKNAEEIAALKDGVRSLLRRNIISDCEKAQQNSYCDIMARDTLKDMFDSYKALGGNGIVKGLVDETFELPTYKLKGENND